MCEVCKLVQEYENHQRDLRFRMHQFTHCLIVGNRDEMAVAENAAVNSLHACFNTLERIKRMCDSLGADVHFDMKDGRPQMKH